MLDLAITPKAQSDLREIWRYTHRTWSAEQADRYLTKINNVISMLRRKPDLGKACEDVAPGLHRKSAERHIIFFRFNPSELIISRVLHDSMDHHLQFANDAAP